MSNLRAEGVIEALTKDGKGFLIDGQWYKCFTPAMMKATISSTRAERRESHVTPSRRGGPSSKTNSISLRSMIF